MKLTNFGTALKFAMAREAHSIDIYEEATRSLRESEAKSLLLALTAACKKRKATLERLTKHI